MSSQLQHRLIPACCVVCGVLSVVWIGQRMQATQAEPDIRVKEQFDALSPEKENLILQKGAAFQRRWTATPKEKEQLEKIHTAVSDSPKLAAKLDQLHAWYLALPSSQQEKIRNAKTEDWHTVVQDLYLETQLRADQIVVRSSQWGRSGGSELRFTEQDYNAFLNDLIPDPIPRELAERLAALAADDEGCERTLEKSLWVLEHIPSPFQPRGPNGEQPSMSLQADVVRNAFRSHLIDSTTIAEHEWIANELKSTDPRRSFGLPLTFMRPALEHFNDQLNAKYLDGKNLVDVFASLDRDKQMEHLKLDPKHSTDRLSGLLIKESIEEGSAIYSLVDRLNARRMMTFRFMFQSRSRSSRSGRGGGGGGGGAGGSESGGNRRTPGFGGGEQNPRGEARGRENEQEGRGQPSQDQNKKRNSRD